MIALDSDLNQLLSYGGESNIFQNILTQLKLIMNMSIDKCLGHE